MVRDLVALDGVGAAVAGHAAKQRFRLGRGRVGARRLAAAGGDIEHHHAAVGRVIDVTGGIGAEKIGLGAGGNFLPHGRDKLPGPDQALARIVIFHLRSFNGSGRRGGKLRAARDALAGVQGERAAAVFPVRTHGRAADGAIDQLPS